MNLTPRFLFLAFLGITARVHAQTAADLIARGDSAYAQFQATEALALYESAVGLDSMNVEALGKASRSAVDLGEHETQRDARAAFYRKGEALARLAVAADSGDADAWFHLARALGRTALSVGVRDRVKYAVEIRRCALKALAINPDHAGALHVMGMWNAEVKRLSGFELFFARRFLGGNVLGEANWHDAVTYMERAVAVDPDRLTHHLDLAGVYADVGEKEKARQNYQQVIDATTRTDFNDALYKEQAEAALRRLR